MNGAEVLLEEKPPFSGAPAPKWPLFDGWQEPFMAWADVLVAPLKWNGMRTWGRRVTGKTLQWLDGVLGLFAGQDTARVGGTALTYSLEPRLHLSLGGPCPLRVARLR